MLRGGGGLGGAVLAPQTKGSPGGLMPCGQCGQDYPINSRYCNGCGRLLLAGPDPVRSPMPASGTPAADTLDFLGSLPPFGTFSPEQLALLARNVQVRSLAKGDVLFREGDAGGEMFFVRRGTILISKLVTGNIEKVLARMRPGDFFGEMSLFGQLRRSASAQAEEAVVLLGLDRASVLRVTELSPPAGLAFFTNVIQEFSRRLATTDDLVAEVTRWGLEATGLDTELSRSALPADESIT